MDKKTLFRKTVAHFPVGVHKQLTRYQIRKLTKHLMNREDIEKCENNEAEKKRIVREYVRRFPERYQAVTKKIDKVFQTNPRFRDVSRKELADLRREMVFNWYAYGFFPDEFVFFDLAGQNKETEKRREFVSELERLCFRFSANDFSESMLADKAAAYRVFQNYFFRDALIVSSDDDYGRFREFAAKHPVFILKLTRSSRGQGVQLIDMQEHEDVSEYFHEIRQFGTVLLEEKIEQADILGQFNESSVNTVRVSTYLTRDGVVPAHGFFRSGRAGSFIDNAAAGGVFATVDTVNGIISTDGCDEFGYRYEKHPDSGVAFKGVVLPEWDQALAICKEAALKVPGMKYLSFDLAYSKKGWMIVEINSSGQYIHQAGTLKGTREELRTLIQKMDLLVPYEIKSYR
ncbi:MAG: hypothetical protein IKI58_06520 [Oscillospiraceae bacterium]|nr:hypothetical protein [Oscillospiraceae bacterium]